MTFKLTTKERERIRSWLEKRPESSDLPKVWAFERDDGSTIEISRQTEYFGDQEWKVRIAYIIETSYPILMSSPIPGSKDSKGVKPGKMVPKDYAKMVKASQPIDEEAILAEVKASMKASINAPNVLIQSASPWSWDGLEFPAPAAIWDDHQTHVDAHLEALKAQPCPACGEPGCHCYEGGI